MNYAELGDKVKTKYPEYKDIDSAELGQKTAAKYPEYKSMITETKPVAAESPRATVNPSEVFKQFLSKGGSMTPLGPQMMAANEMANQVGRVGQAAIEPMVQRIPNNQMVPGVPITPQGIGRFAGAVATDPRSYVAPMIQAGIPAMANAERAFMGYLSKTGKGIANKVGLNYPEKLASLQSQQASIANTASREIGATEAQIKYNIGNIEQAKAQSVANMTSLTKEAEALNAKAIGDVTAKQDALGTKLPDVAYASGQKLKDRFISVIRKHSDMYSQKLNSLLGGKNSSINIDTDSVTSAIEETLLSRGVPTVIDDAGKITIDSAASAGERRLINLYNKIQDQTSVNLRDVIRNKQMLGRSVRYGSKGYNYDDDLLNDAVHRLGSRIEKELPGIKGLNQETSKFLRIKDEANMRLDLFKQGSTKPREFVEKFAKSGMNPEERVFLSKLRTELPDFDRLAKAPRALGEGMKKYEEALQMLKKNDPKVQQKVMADFDTEITKLKSNQDVIKARLANEAESKSKPIEAEIQRIEKRVAKLRKIKDTIVTVGSTGAIGYGAVRALNYGYNALFKDT